MLQYTCDISGKVLPMQRVKVLNPLDYNDMLTFRKVAESMKIPKSKVFDITRHAGMLSDTTTNWLYIDSELLENIK